MYREYVPAPALEPYVDRFWTKIVDDSSPPVQRVLPDGCVDILFRLGPRERHGIVVGTMTRAIVVENTAWQHIVAVRFRPGGAFAFLGTPVHELTDLHVALDDFWPDVEAVSERLAAAGDPRDAARALECELMARKVERAELDPVVRAGVRSLQGPKAPRIADLARELGVSRQHLARIFKVQVGIGPKEFERVIRMTRLRDLLVSAPAHQERAAREQRAASFAGAAFELGYYDQSHMIHEFKSLVGLTPSEYAARQVDSIFPIQAPQHDADSPRHSLLKGISP